MLECVPGIGLATATAILTVSYPDEFTIIDRRVLEELDLFPSRLAKRKSRKCNTDDWNADDYIAEYLPRVKECRKRWGRTLRECDRALWGLSVSGRMEQIIKQSSLWSPGSRFARPGMTS